MRLTNLSLLKKTIHGVIGSGRDNDMIPPKYNDRSNARAIFSKKISQRNLFRSLMKLNLVNCIVLCCVVNNTVVLFVPVDQNPSSGICTVIPSKFS